MSHGRHVSERVKVAVLGAGGVGGYFGGRLAQAGSEVHFIARGTHLEALRAKGLSVRSVRGDFSLPVRATDDPAEVGACDYVLFCVKSFDTEEAAGRLGSLITDGTAVISLQNGVDNEERIAVHIGWNHVMGGVAYIFSTIAEPGVIDDAGGPGRIVVGEWDGSLSERGTRLVELFRDAAVDADLSDHIRSILWNKFAFICAQAGMTAAVRLPIGQIRDVPEGRGMFRRIAEEVCAVAAAEGVELPPDLPDEHLAFADALEPGGYSSLHHDLTHGRRMELEALHGTVVRLASARGVPAPMSEAVYAILRPWAVRNESGPAG
jgi:2-dehydropantoate 2-reductase